MKVKHLDSSWTAVYSWQEEMLFLSYVFYSYVANTEWNVLCRLNIILTDIFRVSLSYHCPVWCFKFSGLKSIFRVKSLNNRIRFKWTCKNKIYNVWWDTTYLAQLELVPAPTCYIFRLYPYELHGSTNIKTCRGMCFRDILFSIIIRVTAFNIKSSTPF